MSIGVKAGSKVLQSLVAEMRDASLDQVVRQREIMTTARQLFVNLLEEVTKWLNDSLREEMAAALYEKNVERHKMQQPTVSTTEEEKK